MGKKAKSWWHQKIELQSGIVTPTEFLTTAWETLTDLEITQALNDAGCKKATRANVQKMRQSLGLRKHRGVPQIFEQSDTMRYDKPPEIVSDNVLVMADVHAPYHNAEWCAEVVYTARRAGITDAIIAGDLFDFAAFSSFAKHITVNGDDSDITVEIQAAADFVDVLLSSFDRVLFTLGNHEKRLARIPATGVRVRTSLIRALLGQRFEERLRIEPYYYSIIKSSTGKWRVTHPKNSSVIPLRVAARMADIKQMNVVAAHGHDVGWTTSASGEYYAAACGCCADIKRLDYVQLEDNLRPAMQNGAWMLRDGRPMLLHPVYGAIPD